MIDKSKDLIVAALLPADVYETDNTPAAVQIDNAKDATIILDIGAGGITFDATNKVEFKLTASDDGESYAAVADGEVVGATVGTGGIIKSLIAAHAAATIDVLGYIGSAKYLKLLADFSGTHATGTAMSAYVVQGEAYLKPQR